MKKGILVLSVFASLFFTSCEIDNLNDYKKNIYVNASDKDEEPDPDNR